MARTHKHLWQQVATLGNLMQAANLAMRGKRSLAPAAGFFAEWAISRPHPIHIPSGQNKCRS